MFEKIPENTDDFVFDNQMLLQILYFGFNIGEVSKYFDDASSINFSRSVQYGLGVLQTATQYFLSKRGLKISRIFNPEGRKAIP